MSPSPRTQSYSLAEIANSTMEPWTRMYAERFGAYGVGLGTSARR
jgi:hypothetical protein